MYPGFLSQTSAVILSKCSVRYYSLNTKMVAELFEEVKCHPNQKIILQLLKDCVLENSSIYNIWPVVLFVLFWTFIGILMNEL